MAATACGEIYSRPMLDKHAHGFMAISENGLVECGFPAQWGLGVYRCTQRQQMFQQRYVSCRRRKRQRSPFIKPVVIDVGTVINERSYHLQMIAPAGGHNRWLIKFTATATDINPFADKPRESSHITFLDSLMKALISCLHHGHSSLSSIPAIGCVAEIWQTSPHTHSFSPIFLLTSTHIDHHT